ncbi:MAG TPA: ThuA domain-containing protein [Fimbriiglobus sp.]|jgi:type 1 glutamine amidotransferase|nr:ThuA domain-containing protein [Fimbriiglobus sp.]
MNLRRWIAVAAVLLLIPSALPAADPWLTVEGGDGPGKGKHVVLVSGDEEYRSEETLTQLAKILAKHHGFTCTVLFAIDPTDGTINPNVTDNIPGLEKLKTADLMVIFLRWRTLPDEQLKHIIDYVEAGKPVVGLRTSTHAVKPGRKGPYAKYTSDSKVPGYEGGFGKQVLGETWVNHHGKHGTEGTRGIVAPGQEKHPILRGIEPGSIFGPTDVYEVRIPLPEGSAALVLGEVTETLKPDSKPVTDTRMRNKKEIKLNDPMMPVAWTKMYKSESGKSARVFTTTMGASRDFAHEGTRRMLVNGCYWALEMEDRIPAKSNVSLVGEFRPSPFRNNGFKKGVKPEDLK